MHPDLAGVAFRLVIVRTVVRPPKGRSEGKDLGRFAAETETGKIATPHVRA